MFSKEMEALIQATLEDGILEENEKAALIKRAQKEGIDLDELEIYINSILQKRKRELAKEEDAKQTIVDQKKKEAIGSVCPKCGKQVPPLTLKCDCGYEFTTSKSASSVQLFFEKINNIQLTDAEIDSCSDVIEEHSEGRRHHRRPVARAQCPHQLPLYWRGPLPANDRYQWYRPAKEHL